MKAGWKTTKLGEALSVLRNGVNCKQDKGGKGEKVSRIESIADAIFNPERVGYAELSATEKARYRLRPGDILFSHINSAIHVGKTAIFDSEEEVYHGVNLLLMRPKPEVTPDYLNYALKLLFQSGYWRRTCKQSVNQASVNQQDISKIEIQYPQSIAEQQRIVGIIDEAFDGIATTRANAEQNLQNARALFESHLQSVFTEWGEGWGEMPIGKLCQRLHQGLNTAGEKIKFVENGYPIIQTRNIDEGVVDLDHKMKFMSEDDWHLYKDKYRPEIGDVFFTNIGTIGKTAIVTEERDYLIHWNIFKLRPHFDLIGPAYFRYALEQLTLSGYFKRMQKGGTVDFVTKKMISEATLPLPSMAEQAEIVCQLDAVREETQNLEALYQRKIDALDELKKSLLNQAFSGNL